MRKFQIDVWVGMGFFCTEVEAETEEEAKEKAWDEIQGMKVSDMNIVGSEEYEICKDVQLCDVCHSEIDGDVHKHEGMKLCEDCYYFVDEDD